MRTKEQNGKKGLIKLYYINVLCVLHIYTEAMRATDYRILSRIE